MSKLAKISKILGSVLEHFTLSQELTLQGGDGGKKIVGDFGLIAERKQQAFSYFQQPLVLLIG